MPMEGIETEMQDVKFVLSLSQAWNYKGNTNKLQ